MKIRNIIALCLAFAAFVPAFAQEEEVGSTKWGPDNYWFAGMGGGMNFSFDGQKFHKKDRENSHNGAGTAIDVFVGKRFNKFAAARIGYQGLSTSNQFTDYGKNRLSYVHADVLFHVTNWFVPYVHAGYARIDRGGGGGGIGIMTPIRVSKRVAIVPDVKAIGHSNKLFNDGQYHIGATITGTIGLVFNLGRTRKAAPVVIPGPVPEIIRVRDTVTVIQQPAPVKTDTVYRDVPGKEREINDALKGIVLFDFDKYDLTDEARAVLDAVSSWLVKNDDINAVIEGHTDNYGSDEYNQVLSENRANAVRNYLIDHGVAGSRLSCEGYGESRPITDNSTPELRHRNRRIEFRLSESE